MILLPRDTPAFVIRNVRPLRFMRYRGRFRPQVDFSILQAA